MEDLKNHWENIYHQKLPTKVSWYQPHLKQSLDWIQKAAPQKTACLVDVGGGASTLVDDLLVLGYDHITVLDMSSKALGESRNRLGMLAKKIQWLEGNITEMSLPQNSFDVWHDRAVFHFLTNPQDRNRYLQILNQSLKPHAFVVMSTFSLNGPLKCSGLEIQRYSPETLLKEFTPGFRLLDSKNETHQTPFDTTQEFVYCLFQKI